MHGPPRTIFSVLAGLLLGCACSVALVAVWNLVGAASVITRQDSYSYSQYLLACISWPFVAVYFVLSVVLGLILRQPWVIAAGMILPFPIILALEVTRDPTSHNLMPFEVLMYWLPAFGLALAGAYLGRMVSGGFRRRTQPLDA